MKSTNEIARGIIFETDFRELGPESQANIIRTRLDEARAHGWNELYPENGRVHRDNTPMACNKFVTDAYRKGWDEAIESYSSKFNIENLNLLMDAISDFAFDAGRYSKTMIRIKMLLDYVRIAKQKLLEELGIGNI